MPCWTSTRKIRLGLGLPLTSWRRAPKASQVRRPQLPGRNPDTLHSLKRFCYYVSPAGKMDISDDSDAEWADGSSDQLLGKPRPRLGGLYQLPHPDCVSLHRVLRV